VLPLSNGAEGRHKDKGLPYKVSVECRLEVDPYKMSTLIFLSRQDVSNKMVSIKEPALPDDVQDFEHKRTILLREGRWDWGQEGKEVSVSPC